MNIILQHWSGHVDELVRKSTESIEGYAKHIGVEYKFIQGNVFKPHLMNRMTLPYQKLHYLDEKWDVYDDLVMVDADMFVRKGVTENIFDCTGIGRHTQIQTNLRKGLSTNYGSWGRESAPYWGGSVIKLTRKQRQLFRSLLTDEICSIFGGSYQDEGVLHILGNLAGMNHDDPNMYLEGQQWNHSSFEYDVAKGNFIHIRTKIRPQGPKTSKINNYRTLYLRGLI